MANTLSERCITSKFLAIIATLAAFSFCGCGSAFYEPTSLQHENPATQGLSPDEVWFKSEDGAKLHGWHFASTREDRPKALIVFFHGNSRNISWHFKALSWILPYGYSFFVFDYRGYGESEGKPSAEGTIKDGRAALDWAQSHHSQIPLVVLGQSLGGAIAMKAVAEMKSKIPIEAIAVDSTFTSYQDVGAYRLASHWYTWLFQPLAKVLLSDAYAPKEDIKKISPIPLLVIHGDQDEVVPFSEGEKIFALAGQPKEFWRIKGGKHVDAFWRQDDDYRTRFVQFLDRKLSKPKSIHE